MEKEIIGMLSEEERLWLHFNAQLQQKKHALRNLLKEKGILVRGGFNKFDNYKYFSEAQYKELFTGLLTEAGLELKFDELEYESFAGTEKQSNGRVVKIKYTLYDIDTGFGESTVISGEGLDKGDKAGYKAYTGTLKYFLANTFMVATGDDPETESPEVKAEVKKKAGKKATEKQVEILSRFYKGDKLEALLQFHEISKLEDMPIEKASLLIEKLSKMKKEGE